MNSKLNFLTFTAASTLALTACKKDDKDPVTSPTASAAVPAPGAIMATLDGAMGSIGFKGQSAGLLDEDYPDDWTKDQWQHDHCKPVGGGVLEGQSSSTAWGCLLAVKTDGPDTPRGGTARILSIACAVDEAVKAKLLTIDGTEQTVDMQMTDACWGADFVAMVKDYLPQNVKADGNVYISTKITGYTSVPSSWSDVADQWTGAFHVIQDLAGTASEYKMLVKSGSDGTAASVWRKDSDKANAEIFAMALSTNADGIGTFRFEGRFPFAEHSDNGNYGSSHTRVVVTGPMTDNTFSAVTGGNGYEASMYGNQSGGSAINSGMLKTFSANANGLGTKDYNLLASGSVNGNPISEWENSGDAPTSIDYTASASEKKAFLAPDLADFTDATAWHKANGPLAFDSAVVGD